MKNKVIIIMFMLLLLLTGTVSGADEIISKKQLNRSGIKIGISQGSVVEDIIREEIPKAAIVNFTDKFMGYEAVAQGKIDAFIYDKRQMAMSIENGRNGVHLLNETLDEKIEIAVGISSVSKIPDLEDKINDFIEELQENGTLDEMFQRWVLDENDEMPEIELPSNPQYHLTVGTAAIVPPYSYYKGTELNGYDIELAYRFASRLGADLSFEVINFDGLIPAAATGKIDCIMSNLQVSDERSENILYSDILYEESSGIMVRGDAAQIPEEQSKAPADFLQYDGKRIGVVTGSTGGPAVEANLPNAKIFYFDSLPDMLTALRSQKVDAVAATESMLKYMQMEGENIKLTDDHLISTEIGALFPKNDKGRKLEAQYSEFVRKLWSDGTIDEINSIWFGEDEDKKTVIEYENLPETNGTLTMAVDTGFAPFVYMKDGKIVGYDVDIAARFCEAYGYRLKIQNMSFPAIIPSVVSGKSDFSACDIAITPERAESVLFSEPTYYDGLVTAVPGDGTPEPESAADSGITSSILAMDGKTIGVLTGSTGDRLVMAALPAAKCSYYGSVSDMLTALKTNKIDASVWDDSIARYMIVEGEPITIIDGYLETLENAAVFAKNEKGRELEAQYSEYVKKLLDDGTMTEIDAKWFGTDESQKTVIDYESLPDTNGTLVMAVDPSMAPFVYMKDNRIMGCEIEIAAGFCEEYGYRLDVRAMSFGAMIPAIVSGKADFASSCITITPERAESVLFSEPIYRGGAVLVVKDENPSGSGMNAASSGSESDESPESIPSMFTMNGKDIGVVTGSFADQAIEEQLPDAEISYFDSMSDMLMALKSRKIDAMTWDDSIIRYLIMQGEPLVMLDGYLAEIENAAIFAKNDKGKALEAQYSEFLKKLWADGTIAEIDAKWYSEDESQKTVIDYQNLPDTNGKLILATDPTMAPFTYMKDNVMAGYEIDIAARFCQEYGYRLEVQSMSFGAMIPAVLSGKADFASSCITITPERAESVLFSEPVYKGGLPLVVMGGNDSVPVPDNSADPAFKISDIDGKHIGVLTGAAAGSVEEETSFGDVPEGIYDSLSELSGKTIAIQTGTSFDKSVLNVIPDAEILYVNSKADLVNSVTTLKADAFATDEPVAKTLMRSSDKLTYIPEYMDAFEFGYVFAKDDDGKKLRDQFSEFLQQIKSDGTLKVIDDRWLSEDESDKTIADYKSFPAPNGTLRMATEALYEPFSYIANDEIVGYDIDIAVHFCEAYGYGLEITDMSFDAVLPSVQSGKADFGGAGITITAERAESVLFSEPNYSGGTVVVVLREEETDKDKLPEFKTFTELNGKTVSMLNGAPFEELVSSKGAEAGQFTYYNNMPDIILALTSGKTDAFITNSAVAKLLANRNEELALFPENLEETSFGFAFAKGSEEREIWQAAYDTIPEKTKQDLWRKWTGSDESKKVLPSQDWPGSNGTVTVAACDTLEPMSYKGKGGELIGFDEEIILLMAKELDVHVNFTGMEFSVILSTVQSGKALFGTGSIMITKERAESVDFIPYYPAAFVLLVRTADYADKINTPAPSKLDTVKSGFSEGWESIKASFEKTFIREDRWRLFLEGIGNTLLITVLSIIFGTILGFLLFMLCRNGNPLTNGITAVCMWLVQGMPGVVLLMILFYIVFGTVSIDGIVVAVIGFSLTFSAAVFGLLKIGVGAIDTGQYEAAYALGYSNMRTFFRIILPQAIPHVMGAYKGEIVGLLKATAIVGYIAVQDLTKMGDIVRSRTYEAFFPLIAVTIIYFVLEGILGFIIRMIIIQIDPKRRKRSDILKGVKTND